MHAYVHLWGGGGQELAYLRYRLWALRKLESSNPRGLESSRLGGLAGQGVSRPSGDLRVRLWALRKLESSNPRILEGSLRLLRLVPMHTCMHVCMYGGWLARVLT